MRRSVITWALALLGGCRSVAPAELLGRGRAFELVVQGNDSLARSTIERAIAFELDEFERNDFDPSFADDAAFQALLLYREQGYPAAEVDFVIEGGRARPVLVLRVDEGPRTLLDEERFAVQGARELARDEVLSFFLAERGGLLGGGEQPYVADRVEAARAALEREYLARGYLDVRVAPPEVRFTEDETRALLSLAVEEGARYLCGDVAWDGAELPPALREKLRAEAERFPLGEAANGGRASQRRPYTPRVPFELQASLLELLADAGRPDAEVVVSPEPEEEREGRRLVPLRVAVRPGPEVLVGALSVRGNERTRAGLVLSRLRLAPGDRWSHEQLQESVRRLYRTGLFRRVEITAAGEEDAPGADAAAGEDADPGARKVVRDLVVVVDEAPTRELFIEPGYGSWELFRLKAGLRERNVLGTGRQLRVEGDVAVRALRGQIALRDPWLFESDFDLIGDLTLTFDEREHPAFTHRSTGAGAFVTKEWSESDSTTFGYQFRRSAIFDVDVLGAELDEVSDALDDVDLSSLRLSHRSDRRDNPLLPTRNTYLETSLEWGDRSLGSELDFVRSKLTLAGYHSLGPRTVLAAAFRTGIISPLGSDDTIPLQERFFNGGENTVRSFLESELGPADSDGNPLGGEAFHVANLELRRRLGETRLELALFYDVGDLVEQAGDWGHFGDLRSGVGLGVRYLLPIGPLRLDVATNPDAREGEDDFAVHFAIGFAF